VARAIARYSPGSVSPDVVDFARALVEQACPKSVGRAKALLFAAARLGSFAVAIGLELRPEVVLRESVIERFIIVRTPQMSPAMRRTLRSNLRFLAAATQEHRPPAPVPLSRERAKAPYAPAEIEAYLALAEAQPTLARRMRLSGLIALGAGAGLMGADLRGVCGTDVVARCGGVVVEVNGRRPRVVPVLARYHERVLASARFAGSGYVTGGFSASRRNVTAGLKASVAGGRDLPALDTGRLRVTWLATCAEMLGLGAFMEAAGITCSQRLGDLVAHLGAVEEGRAVSLLGAAS
jgi:hypothetical protein